MIEKDKPLGCWFVHGVFYYSERHCGSTAQNNGPCQIGQQGREKAKRVESWTWWPTIRWPSRNGWPKGYPSYFLSWFPILGALPLENASRPVSTHAGYCPYLFHPQWQTCVRMTSSFRGPQVCNFYKLQSVVWHITQLLIFVPLSTAVFYAIVLSTSRDLLQAGQVCCYGDLTWRFCVVKVVFVAFDLMNWEIN